MANRVELDGEWSRDDSGFQMLALIAVGDYLWPSLRSLTFIYLSIYLFKTVVFLMKTRRSVIIIIGVAVICEWENWR